MEIHPFQIDIPEGDLQDLQQRLRQTRWAEAVRGAGWEYGADLAYMQELVDYWIRQFDWRAQEHWLNSFPQFQAEIDGLRIHFVHMRGKGENPIPLLLVHGYPSSFMEMLKLASLLAGQSFDVVIPSVPGFGFSGRPLERGMSRSKVGGIFLKLMDALGYRKFGAHANDIGAVITAYMADSAPGRFIGFHTLMPTFPSPDLERGKPPSPAEKQFTRLLKEWDREEGGYNLLLETRPQTIGYALNDSPAGMAAWIIEKWRAWGALDGNLDDSFSKDELLTNVSIYWLTETANSSARSYYERAHDPNAFPKGRQISVPTGVALTLEPVQRAPREWVERVYTDIRHWTEFDRGGHFAALEHPQMVAQDIQEFFDLVGK